MPHTPMKPIHPRLLSWKFFQLANPYSADDIEPDLSPKLEIPRVVLWWSVLSARNGSLPEQLQGEKERKGKEENRGRNDEGGGEGGGMDSPTIRCSGMNVPRWKGSRCWSLRNTGCNDGECLHNKEPNTFPCAESTRRRNGTQTMLRNGNGCILGACTSIGDASRVDFKRPSHSAAQTEHTR
ncbi:hypothetical protein CIRG_07311 [Coccidioides immitis RMSCC 2394]|uniref:Uncharacterized protein n=1 Tax=Coccidioides immitis RMSCC 2394 TaxID=404692 RepID=A0A0J6YJ23_COCIT|nr:hypothetical protein CIRG_07311 [Coccidioides immitis RMSCC 2394]